MAKGREKINHDILFEGDSQKGSLQGIERKKKKRYDITDQGYLPTLPHSEAADLQNDLDNKNLTPK